MKCPIPIAYPSPSPPAATTVNDGFASFTPTACARSRPWRAWIPLTSRKLWIEPEHPIPPTNTRSCVGILRLAAAFLTAARRLKSPQPGHQIGGTGFADCTMLGDLLHFGDDLRGAERVAVVLEDRTELLVMPGQ